MLWLTVELARKKTAQFNSIIIYPPRKIIGRANVCYLSFIIDCCSCGYAGSVYWIYPGSPAAVCVAEELKKPLTKDTVAESLCCVEDAQVCLNTYFIL